MPSIKCDHASIAPAETIEALPPSQGGTGRHKCVVCAFAEGLNASTHTKLPHERCEHGNVAPTPVLAALPESQAGPGRHRCATCSYAAGAQNSNKQADDVATQDRLEQSAEDEGGRSEGNKKTVVRSVYERDPKNRAEAVRIHSTTCQVCGFNFDAFYGAELARAYIEVHHLTLVSQAKGAKINPRTDMATLCSNCHSMTHRSVSKLVSLEELRQAISKQKGDKTVP